MRHLRQRYVVTALVGAALIGCAGGAKGVTVPRLPKLDYELISESPLCYRLREDLVYIDHYDKKWVVPKGVLLKASSLPDVIWDLNGGPFNGAHGWLFAIHEYYAFQADARAEQLMDLLAHGLSDSNHTPDRIAFYICMYGMFGARFEWGGGGETLPPYSAADTAFIGFATRAWRFSDRESLLSKALIGELLRKGRIMSSGREERITQILRDSVANELRSAKECKLQK